MYIAIDIGGSTCKLAAYDTLQSLRMRSSSKFPMSRHHADKPGDFQADYRNLVRQLRRFEEAFGAIQGIGLALAGKLDLLRTGLIMAGNIAHWVHQPVRDMLEREFGCPVVLGNDAEAAALAEARYGVGARGWHYGQPFLGMIWGTGIGGAYVSPQPGRLVDLYPGEPGHIRISDSPLKCRGCAEPGHVEALCGGGNLRDRFGRPGSRLTKVQWKEVVTDLAFGLKNMLVVLPPVKYITFSGTVAYRQEWALSELQAQLDEVRYGSPQVLLSSFRASAGSLGALSLLTL